VKRERGKSRGLGERRGSYLKGKGGSPKGGRKEIFLMSDKEKPTAPLERGKNTGGEKSRP